MFARIDKYSVVKTFCVRLTIDKRSISRVKGNEKKYVVLKLYSYNSEIEGRSENTENKKNLHKLVELKEPYFLPNIATNLSKNNDFANSVHLLIDRMRNKEKKRDRE